MLVNVSGLYYLVQGDYGHPKRQYLPQVSVKSHTTISATCYTTKLRQYYINPGDKQTEATYAFPLYDGVAVVSFTCTIGDREITGHVEGKKQARETYQKAIDRGETAGLLESLPAGIFSVSVGGIPARSNVIVDIEYGAELKHDAQIDGIRYNLPLSIAPRYGQYPGDVLKVGTNTIHERGIQIDVDFDLGSLEVASLQTASPIFEPLLSTQLNTNRNGRSLSASASLQLEGAEMAEDFVLLAKVPQIGAPHAIAEIGDECITTMATFVPKFKLPNIEPEIVFIADQSGSMAGSKTKSLIDSLNVFLKSLPVNTHFNICPFGSRHSFLFRKSMPYNQETAAEALAFIQTFRAQYGGTEMQTPIEKVFEMHNPERPLEIILLTDGEIWQEQQLFDFVNQQIVGKGVDARIFCLGIGNDVSHSLVEGIARAGRGVAQFVTVQENLDQKVVRMLKASLYPHFRDVTVKADYLDDDFEIVQDETPTTTDAESISGATLQDKNPSSSLFDDSADLDDAIPGSDADMMEKSRIKIDPFSFNAPSYIPLFPFSRTTLYCMHRGATLPPSLTITATSTTGAPLTLTIPIQKSPQTTSTIRKLAARTYIQELEAGRSPLTSALINSSSHTSLLAPAITLLGTTHQVVSKHTSFVAVEKDSSTGRPDSTDANAQAQFGGPARPMARSANVTSKQKRSGQDNMFFSAAMSLPDRSSGVSQAVPPPPPMGRSFGAMSGPSSTALFGGPPAPAPATTCSFGGGNGNGNTGWGGGGSGLFGAKGRVNMAGSGWGGMSRGNGFPGGDGPMDQRSRHQGPGSWDAKGKEDIGKMTLEERLRIVITEQSFDGSWEWSERLIQALKLGSWGEGEKLDRKEVTKKVLEMLKSDFKELEDVWDLCAEKAEAWLSS
ncbi:hypothetical protein CAC42_1778 [Sphaceloma murrayae]|uniref:von Willebrand factor A domain-containing protein 5A n=1 Tax=Sphaceloma murrayae TaxID=2082308 RepID=A0A2K1QVG1_9PEZI|nr:hypothetical protein CAC42_1778 [Sphaceloma murrayae]